MVVCIGTHSMVFGSKRCMATLEWESRKAVASSPVKNTVTVTGCRNRNSMPSRASVAATDRSNTLSVRVKPGGSPVTVAVDILR